MPLIALFNSLNERACPVHIQPTLLPFVIFLPFYTRHVPYPGLYRRAAISRSRLGVWLMFRRLHENRASEVCVL